MDIEDTFEEPEELINSEDLPSFRMSESTEFDSELEMIEEEPQIITPINTHATPQYILPDVIKSFILHFYKHVKDQNVYELHAIYENSFNK